MLIGNSEWKILIERTGLPEGDSFVQYSNM
jgi:hypothetical protein